MTTVDSTTGVEEEPVEIHSTAEVRELKVPRGAASRRVERKEKYSAAAVLSKCFWG